MKPIRSSLFVLLLCLAPRLAGAAEYVTWLEPVDGAVVEAGSAIRLAWQPGPDFAQVAWAHEWEIFLSVDGGRTFPRRITPHLDLTRRSVSVEAPLIPAADVRLLLRVGNERREFEQALEIRLAIVAAVHDRPTSPSLFAKIPAPRRGEPARAGDGGVFSWVIETKSGRFVEVAVGDLGVGLSSVATADFTTIFGLTPEPQRLQLLRPKKSGLVVRPRASRLDTRSPADRGSGILLLIQRFNI